MSRSDDCRLASDDGTQSRLIPIVSAAPALLVPAIVAISIFWARQKFFDLSPLSFATGSPTISRSISDPNIAVTFAGTVTIAATLLAIVCWRIIRLYSVTIDTAFRHELSLNTIAKLVLVFTAIAEFCSIVGIVMLSWFSQRNLHIGGSYLFFFGQAAAILFSGILCSILRRAPAYDYARGWPTNGLSPTLSLLRSRVAPAIAAGSLIFWMLFIARSNFDQAPRWLNVSFSVLEFTLILFFLSYLASFSLELYRAQKHS